MKTKIPIVLLFLLAIPLTIQAKFSKYVGLGVNRSSFRTEDSKSLWGPSFEFGIDYYPIKSFSGFIGSGISYQNKRLFLEKRTWPSDVDMRFSEDVHTGDFNISISFLELPLQLGYSLKINAQFSLNIFSGYSLAIPLKDHTTHKNRKTRQLLINERGTYQFDYHLTDELGVPITKNQHIGCRLSYDQYILLISYVRSLSSTQSLAHKSVDDKIDTFKILLAYQF